MYVAVSPRVFSMIKAWRVVSLTICSCVVLSGIALQKSGFADEPATAEAASPPIKVGILGMDNYQCVAFMQLWHQQETLENLAGLRVVAAYPGEPSSKIEKSAYNLQKWV